MKDCWKILIIDDEESIHAMTKLVIGNLKFEGKSIEFYSAYSGLEGKKMISEIDDIAVILLDIVMESKSAGLDLVRAIRGELKNYDVRIIIRTGQPGTAPESEVIIKYDINDYREKTELNYQKLTTSVLLALRSYRDLKVIRASKAELILAKCEAENANKIKAQFLANMSHEMRTPMNGIMGITQLLSYTELSKQQKEYLDLLKESNGRLMDTINDILDLSKIEAGTVEIKRRPVDLKEFYRSIIKKFEVKFKIKDITFDCYFDSKLPNYIFSDEHKLNQIISNLLSNALKFTQRGVVSFRIKHKVDDYIFIEIEDSGIGMSEESLTRIFDIFTQADESNTRKFGGSGLGLSITQKLVNMMNGSIEVESTLGEGSIFKIKINAPYILIEESSNKICEKEFKRISEMKVLLAESDLINQKIITTFLEKITKNIDFAIDGQQVIMQVKEEKYDIIFINIGIPVINGISLTEFIRKLANYKQVPIIALTTHIYSNIKEVCTQNGMTDYLSKPIISDEFYYKIYKYIDNGYTNSDYLLDTLKTTDINYTLGEVVTTFMDTNYIEKLILNIEKYYNEGNENQLRKYIDKGKLSFETVGFNRGYQLLKRIEELNIKNEIVQFESLTRIIKEEVYEFKNYYQQNKSIWGD